jgi:hypothetical protein
MGRPGGSDLSAWVNPVNTALSRYSLNSSRRIIAFLSQVRHETAGMTVFHQSMDNGGGLLHMVPSNWLGCCKAVPEIKQEFANRYAGCSECSCVAAMAADPMGSRTTDAAINIFKKPLLAALSAGWWFDAGAIAAFGWKGCTQPLRVYADQGRGNSGSSGDCYHTGDYQLTCCIFWTIGGAASLSQRLSYYDQAVSYAKSKWGYSGAEAEEITQFQMNPAVNVGIVIGCAVGVIALVMVVVALYLKRKHRLQAEVV